MSVQSCFIRGSVVRLASAYEVCQNDTEYLCRYVQLNPADVDVELMQDSSRVEAREQKKS